MTRKALWLCDLLCYSAIPRPLIETQRLYETGRNLRQYGIFFICKYIVSIGITSFLFYSFFMESNFIKLACVHKKDQLRSMYNIYTYMYIATYIRYACAQFILCMSINPSVASPFYHTVA